MTLDNLLRIGKLKPHVADKAEIARLLSDGIAQVCAAEAASVLAEVSTWIAAHRPNLA